MENLTISVELLRSLAPEAGMDQDEQGGCVWCGGSASGLWSRPIAEDHRDSCPWLAARRLLAASGEEPPTLRQVANDDPALRRILSVSADPIFAALAQTPRGRNTRQDDAMRRRRFYVIENGPDNCLAVIVYEVPALRDRSITISYLYVDISRIDPGYVSQHVSTYIDQLLRNALADAQRMGFPGLQVADSVPSVYGYNISAVLASIEEVTT